MRNIKIVLLSVFLLLPMLALADERQKNQDEPVKKCDGKAVMGKRPDVFKNLLTDARSRNLFYFGHGTPSEVGVDNGSHLKVNDIENLLTNTVHNGWFGNANGVHAEHPSRFVFLDGCDTSEGDLSWAFGIPNWKISQSDWDSKYHSQALAFVGWNKGAGRTVGNVMPQNHKDFIERFFRTWGGNGQNQLQPSLHQASINPGTGEPNHPALGDEVIIYGCPTLLFYQ